MMYGVFYKTTKNARIFAGLKDELIAEFDNFEEAKSACEVENMGGYLDELHSGYVVRPLKR